MKLSNLFVLAAAGCCASMASAQVVIPNAYATTSSGGTGLNTFIRDTGNPRSGQLLINANQLTTIVGQQIDGLTFRMYSLGTTFPATDATWADYTINVGAGVAFGAQTTTFATNFVGAPVTVRSGPLTILANSFPGGAVAPTPNAFGSLITFNTPYTYTGGNLLIEIRHTGSNIVNVATNFLEAVALTDPGNNVNFWSATATGNTATVGAAATFTVTRLHTVPAPGAASLLGVAGLGLVRRRRR